MTSGEHKQIPADSLLQLRQRLDCLPVKSSERASQVAVMAHLYGVSPTTVYRALHPRLGELGRLAVEETASGETSLVTEVSGDVSDPMTWQRRQLLEPLCIELTRMLESARGIGRAVSPPQREPQPAGQVACEEVRCDVCGTMVAFLIFAPGAIDEGSFEDYARMMYPHYAKHDVPTYLIGPERGSGPMRDRPADILKVWPERTPMERLQPDEFNPRVVALANVHCP